MKKKNVLSMIFCLSMILLLFVGCNTKPKSNVAEIIENAQKKFADCKSMSYVINMEMDTEIVVGADKQSFNMSMNYDVKYTSDPDVIFVDMKIDMDTLGTLPIKTYIQKEANEYIMYVGLDLGTDSMYWSKQKIDDIDTVNQYNAQASMSLYLSCSESFKEKGIEQVNGKESTRYDGVISKDEINKIFTSSDILSQFINVDVDEETIKSTLKDLGDLTFSIWVEKESGLPNQYEFDMTNVLKGLLKNMPETSEDVKVNKFTMKMTVTGINNIDHIEIPNEALESEELSSLPLE